MGHSVDHLKFNIGLNELSDSVRIHELDWNFPTLLSEPNKYDIILGSEVIYLETLVEPLVNTINYHLKPDGVVYLVSAKGRAGYLHFFHLMMHLGFTLTTSFLKPPSSAESSFTFSEELAVGWFCEGQFDSDLQDLILVECRRKNC